MDLRHLATAIAVAETLSFTRAAVRLHVSQPALSKQVIDLEKELGITLFERNTHGVHITNAGSVFIEQARRTIAHVEHTVFATRRAAQGDEGSIRIGFIGSLSHHSVPEILRRFHQRYPRVDLDLQEMGPTKQVESLRNRSIDIGFAGMISAEAHPDLICQTIGSYPLMIALPRGHALLTKKTISPTDVGKLSWIMTNSTSAPLYNSWLIEQFRELSIDPRIERMVDRAPSALALVEAGFGISIFPEPVSNMPAPGVEFRPISDLNPYLFSMAWRRFALTPEILQFVNLTKITTDRPVT
jgi:DNA-binding transcriptional LysR family regulator